MNRFISLPWKVLAQTIAAMLVIAVTLTAFSIYQSQQVFEQRQSEKRATAQKLYSHQRKMSHAKRILWLSTLGSQYLVNKSDYRAFDIAVQRQFDLDELGLDSVWIFDQQGNQSYSSGVAADDKIRQVSRQVSIKLATQDFIYCESDSKNCFHIAAMPLLTKANQMKVLLSRSNLSDLLFTMLQLTQRTQLAVVNLDLASELLQTDLKSLVILTMSNTQQTALVIDSLPATTTIADLQHSVATSYEGKYFSTSLFELQPGIRDGNYLMLFEDITNYRQTNQRYQRSVVIIASIIFFLIALIIFATSRRSSKRLLKLAEDLPLLAEKRFDEFRQRELPKTGIISDELDVLNSSLSNLADQLEQLNIKIELNTQELQYMAMYDQLTELPGRNMLNFQLNKCLENLPRQHGSLALLFLDLDDFKKVNDSHGHNVGDFLLNEAALRLRVLIRGSDTAFRFGGDEFVILLLNLVKPDDIESVANKILLAFREPIVCDINRFYVSASIGGVVVNDKGVSAEKLISQADMAMYEAKEKGGNCFRQYDISMYARVANKVLLQGEVLGAISDGQFSLSLQPQIEVFGGKLLGFEALIRWHHPERGMVSPDDFIPVLEDTEHFIELGYWIIRHSIYLLSQLNKAGYLDIGIAINLSAAQFVDPKLFDYLTEQLEHFDISADKIELELTERTLVEDMDKTLATMHRLRDYGFEFSIDDYGTGYSSLSYLNKMPINCVKIDKCFINGMLTNHADKQIVISTITMVHNLGMKVIAEGVEDWEQYQLLKDHKCDVIQGYLFSKPIPEHDLYQELNTKVNNGIWLTALKTDDKHFAAIK